MYQVQRAPRSEFVPIRNLSYHVLVWGEATSTLPPLVLMHGWMDVAASYQFMVDALSAAFMAGRRVIAADWRGYGLTTGPATDNYWFPDYLADLDFLLDHYSPDQPVDLVGHSMGGNVVTMYAGARPERVRRLINLEGFGMPENRAAQAPGRYAKWMDELKSLQRGEMALKAYDTSEGVARRLMKTNPRLARDEAGIAKANWLATHWAAENEQGKWEILGDPAHKITNANLSNVQEALELYQRITAPVLMVEASDDSLSQWWQGKYTLAEFHERLKSVPDCTVKVISDAGHMLHHDQPQQLAAMLEDFFTR
ncbi:MAG: alpha/beta hydrolase [Burkholderiaceae bacterium]|nr:alpha/beta hydrolase [Burkholderiaceae bacterium]